MPDSTNSTFCELTCYSKDIHQPSAIPLEPASPEGLVQSRLDFVVHAALRVAARHENADIELLDLIQEGNIALLEAVKDWTGGRSRARNCHAFVSHRVSRALERSIASAEQQGGRLCSLEEHWDDLCEVEAPDELDLVEVQVDEFGSFLVMAPEWERETPGKQNLISALREAIAGNSDGMRLVVKVHELAKLHALVDAMDAGTIAGYSQLEVTQVEDFD